MSYRPHQPWVNGNSKRPQQASRRQQALAAPLGPPPYAAPGAQPALPIQPPTGPRAMRAGLATNMVTEGMSGSRWAPKSYQPAGGYVGRMENSEMAAAIRDTGKTAGAMSPSRPQSSKALDLTNNHQATPLSAIADKRLALSTPPSTPYHQSTISPEASGSSISDGIANTLAPPVLNRNFIPTVPRDPTDSDINPKTGQAYTAEEWEIQVRKLDRRRLERHRKSERKNQGNTMAAEAMISNESLSQDNRLEILASEMHRKDISLKQIRQDFFNLARENNQLKDDQLKSNAALSIAKNDLAQSKDDRAQEMEKHNQVLGEAEARLAQKENELVLMRDELALTASQVEEHSTCGDRLAKAEGLYKAAKEERNKCLYMLSSVKTDLDQSQKQNEKLVIQYEKAGKDHEEIYLRLKEMLKGSAEELRLTREQSLASLDRLSVLEKAFKRSQQVALENKAVEDKSAADYIEHNEAKGKSDKDYVAQDSHRWSEQATVTSVDAGTQVEIDDKKMATVSTILADSSKVSRDREKKTRRPTATGCANTESTSPRRLAKKSRLSKSTISRFFLGSLVAFCFLISHEFHPITPELTAAPQFESVNQQLVFTPTTCPIQTTRTSAVAIVPTNTVATYATVLPDTCWASQRVIEVPNNSSLIEEDGSGEETEGGMCEIREEFPILRKAIFTFGVAVFVHAAITVLGP